MTAQVTVTQSQVETDPIDQWLASQPEGTAVRVWSYSPNGGVGGPAGETDWGSEEWVREILNPPHFDRFGGKDWDSVEVEPDTYGSRLKLSSTPERGVHQYYELYYQPDPSEGRPPIAYLGNHCGFEWEDRLVASTALEAILDHYRFEDSDLARFGITTCEDYLYGDDGGFWLVANPELFARVSAACKELDLEAEEDVEEDADPEDADWVEARLVEKGVIVAWD